jgi:hypothetical protein
MPAHYKYLSAALLLLCVSSTAWAQGKTPVTDGLVVAGQAPSAAKSSLSVMTSVTTTSTTATPLNTPSTPTYQSVPTTWRATFENWKLPEGETMGMLGTNLLFDVNPNVKLGIASYGAMTGERGGFITLGLASELQKELSENWVAHTGLFVGAGGGAGGYILAGGGFMLRADAGLTYKMGPYGNLGAGVSWVTFPTGQIRSTQPYIMYEYPFDSFISDGWSGSGSGSSASSSSRANTNFGSTASSNTSAPSGSYLSSASNPSSGIEQNPTRFASSKRQEFSVAWTGYKIPSSVTKTSGAAQSSTMQLAGARWTTYLTDRWFLTFQASGAFAGNSAGYMQILGGGGYRLPLGSSTALKFYGNVGPAGGGDVATGGGILYGAGVALQQSITDDLAIEFGLGGVKAGTGDFKALAAGVNLSYVFGLPRTKSGQKLLPNDFAGYKLAPLQLRAINQTYLKGNDQWRSRDVGQSVNNLGFAADYFINPEVYLTGQGLAAYSGDAGAFMTGLIGAGVNQPISKDWFVMAEGLVGAAGGGSLAVGNGSVWQVNAGLGYRINKSLSLMVTGGRMQAPTGDFSANVIGVSLGYRFGLPVN